MKLSSKLGQSYQNVSDLVKIKKITVSIGETSFDLKVRIPLKSEMDDLTDKISNPDKDRIDRIFDALAAPLKESLDEVGSEFVEAVNAEKKIIEVTEDDLIIEGKSIRQIATFSAMYETKVEEYFHLLQSETDEPINEPYSAIAEEFPEPVIKIIVEEIEQVIRPDYKKAKKD